MFKTITGPQGGRVVLDGREVINMASNNYLGLANHPEVVKAAQEALAEYGLGAGAARGIIGNFKVHDELEAELAKFKGTEASCVFNSGYTANVGTIPVLAGKGDDIFSDELNHGSIIDGIRLSHASVHVYPHNDMEKLEQDLAASEADNKLVITDGVFSMDGEIAKVPEIVEIAEKYGAKVMVDDAHGDGVLGDHGRGTIDHFGLQGRIYVETGSLSKGFGSSGGFAAGPADLMEKVMTKARSFILSATPIQPVLAAGALKALQMLGESDELVKKLWHNRDYFFNRASELGFDLGKTETPVIPVLVGGEETAQELSDRLFEKGVFAQAIKFPLVARGNARLRVMISADHEEKDLDIVLDALEEAGRELNLI
ncbi:MAG: aminotransferase class I/II-fold pyridoxal phosphate-dependent enzyme [Anaerovoracaceae bacterium]|nr:aminotransferase class I/II-fold pyridoxal phosphate-dependent enzyme [Anaerovoracaceae bacterium]